MFQKNVQLTHLFILCIALEYTEAFYEHLLGLEMLDRNEGQIFFRAGNCILAVQRERVCVMPNTVSSFTVFESCGNFDKEKLQRRGLSFEGPIEQQAGGRMTWFCGPYDHMHGLWETEARNQVPIALASAASQSPRVAYYFLAVDDLKVAIPFYRDVLGLQFIEAREGLYALFNAGGIVLGLRQGRDAGAGIDAESWTVFETSRCEEFYGELERFGGYPLGIRSETHGKVYWFRSPGGHIQCFHDPQPEYALDSILKRSPMPA